MQLNGFEIEDYNILGLPSKTKTAVCPKCSHTRKPHNQKQKCMSVFWDTGIGHCNHCGERTQLHTYKKRTIEKTYLKPEKKIVKAEFKNEFLDYYQSYRGLSKLTLEGVKLGFSKRWMPKAGKEIDVIEYRYYLHGELINIKYRGKNKDFMFEKGCEQIPYGMDDIIGKTWCVVVEGEEDKHSYYQAGIKNCVSVPNGFTLPREDGLSTINTGYLDSVYHVFENMERIYIAVDNDIAGKHGEHELIRRFGAEKCWLVDFKGEKDANDYLKKYKEEALKQTIDDARQVPLEDVKTISDVEEELDDFWMNGAPKGFTIGIDSFDDCMSFPMGQTTLVTGAPNGGKSDLVDFILAKMAIRYDHKSGICSTENKPLKFHYDKLFKKIYGKRPLKGNIKSDSVIECKDFIDNHFFHVEKAGRYYLDDVLKKFAELVKRKGCRWFVLDPFNKIKIKGFKGDTNEYTSEYHNMLDEFVTKYDAHIFLVVHPVKLKYKDGSKKTYLMPSAYEIKGGGEHFDMAYNIIGMVRDYDFNIVNIRTLKWKFNHTGTPSVDLFVGWNMNNGRYTESYEEFDERRNPSPDFKWDNTNWITGVVEEQPKPQKELFQVGFEDIAEVFEDLPF